MNYVYLPSRFNLPYEDVWLDSGNRKKVKIHCWLMKRRMTEENAISQFKYTPTIIYFHGNAGNMSDRLLNVRDLYERTRCHIFLVEYRGYGKSTGTSSESGLKKDAEAAWRFIQSRRDLSSKNIFLFGRGLGGSVALYLASRIYQRRKSKGRKRQSLGDRRNLKGVIVENTFTSIPDIMPVVVPYLKWFRFACRNQWRNIDYVQNLSLPILFLSGKKDHICPPEMMQSMYEKCPSAKKIIKVFPNGQHNNTWSMKDYYPTIEKFISNHATRKL